MRQLSETNREETFLVALCWVGTDGVEAERQMHDRLRAYKCPRARVEGRTEWFGCTYEQLLQTFSEAGLTLLKIGTPEIRGPTFAEAIDGKAIDVDTISIKQEKISMSTNKQESHKKGRSL